MGTTLRILVAFVLGVGCDTVDRDTPDGARVVTPEFVLTSDGGVWREGRLLRSRGEPLGGALGTELRSVSSGMSRAQDEMLGAAFPEEWLAARIDTEVRFEDLWSFFLECMSDEVRIWKLAVVTVQGHVEDDPLFFCFFKDIIIPVGCTLHPAGPYPVWKIESKDGAALHVFELIGGDLRLESRSPEDLIASIPLEDPDCHFRCEDEVTWGAVSAAMRAMAARGLWRSCPLPMSVEVPGDWHQVWDPVRGSRDE